MHVTKLVGTIENGADLVAGETGNVPSGPISDSYHDEAITAIYEWRKPGSNVGGGPILSHDPATGKQFYTINGLNGVRGLVPQLERGNRWRMVRP